MTLFVDAPHLEPRFTPFTVTCGIGSREIYYVCVGDNGEVVPDNYCPIKENDLTPDAHVGVPCYGMGPLISLSYDHCIRCVPLLHIQYRLNY